MAANGSSAAGDDQATHASHAPFLRLSVLIGDMTDHNLTLAAQAGATDVVAPYTKTRAEMVAARDRIARHGPWIERAGPACAQIRPGCLIFRAMLCIFPVFPR